MAVFTEVSPAEAGALAGALNLGTLVSLQGIGAGIENTNYFVTTRDAQGAEQDWVLTLFERLGAAQLPFYLQLMQHLARRGLPVPEPRADAGGSLVHQVAGKPAALVNRLPGAHQHAPDLHHCAQLGAVLARMHLAVADFAPQQPNLRGLDWWLATAPRVMPHLDADRQALLSAEITFQQQLAASPAHAALPRGAVHADLFRDNVLFDGACLGGFIDFYFAGFDCLLFDVAVCVNDWCIAREGAEAGDLDQQQVGEFLAAYDAVRPFAAEERAAWDVMLRAGALRFWLSRLFDFHLPRAGQLITPHDPGHFERILVRRRARPAPWK